VGNRVLSPSPRGERRPALTGLVRARAPARLAGRNRSPGSGHMTPGRLTW